MLNQGLRSATSWAQDRGAKLFWCSITPLPPYVPRSAAGTETLLAYNAVAKKVMDENGIAIDEAVGSREIRGKRKTPEADAFGASC
jgi:hypothetical protein